MKTIAVAVVESDGRFLVGRRPEGVPQAGCAEFPGGKVESNEKPSTAAVRECREETGIDVVVRELLCQTVHDYDHGQLCIHFFLCEPVKEAALPAPFRWVDQGNLTELNFPEANRQLMQLLIAR